MKTNNIPKKSNWGGKLTKRIIGMVLSVAMLASVGSAVMASEVHMGTGTSNSIEDRALTRCPSCGSSVNNYSTPASPAQYKDVQSGGTINKYQLYDVKTSCTSCPFMSGTTEWKWIGSVRAV